MARYAIVLLLLVLGATPQAAQSPDSASLSYYAVAAVHDLEARVTVDKADLTQLEKINRDFGILYRLREVTIRYRDPDKFRMDNRLGVFIVNGGQRYLRVPQLGLRKKDDMGTALAKRHSLLDIGILTPARLEQLRWRYLRQDTIQGRSLPVFEITFGDEETTRYHLWMDPAKKCVVRRQWFDGTKGLRATFDYLQPVEAVQGVWVPTRIEVRNADGALAGATVYANLKVNQGLPDALFDTEEKTGDTAAPNPR